MCIMSDIHSCYWRQPPSAGPHHDTIIIITVFTSSVVVMSVNWDHTNPPHPHHPCLINLNSDLLNVKAY